MNVSFPALLVAPLITVKTQSYLFLAVVSGGCQKQIIVPESIQGLILISHWSKSEVTSFFSKLQQCKNGDNEIKIMNLTQQRFFTCCIVSFARNWRLSFKHVLLGPNTYMQSWRGRQKKALHTSLCGPYMASKMLRDFSTPTYKDTIWCPKGVWSRQSSGTIHILNSLIVVHRARLTGKWDHFLL